MTKFDFIEVFHKKKVKVLEDPKTMETAWNSESAF